MQQPLCLVLADAFTHGHELVLGHQLGDPLARVFGKAHVAVGQNADQLAGTVAAVLDHRNAGDVVLLAQRERVGKRRLRADGDRVDHHTRLEPFDLPHLCCLNFRIEIAMNHADAAGLRHGDRHLGFGHRIHGRGDNRNIERYLTSDLGAHVHLGGQHVR